MDEWLPAAKLHREDGGSVSGGAAFLLSAPSPLAAASGLLHHGGGLGSHTHLHLSIPRELSGLSALTPGGLLSPGGLASPGGAANSENRKLTRNLKRRYDEMHHVPTPVEELAPLEARMEREHEEKTKVKNIRTIEFGAWDMDTWYYAPFPPSYSACEQLYMCEFCMKYMRKRRTLAEHKAKCSARCPPGTEIYRHPQREAEAKGCAPPPALSMWEVDGKKAKTYCQSLCLLAKLFLDHKTLYYDTDPFLFYILTERDASPESDGAHHVVGYFSKEKASTDDFNLACICTLPPFQRKGYGKFLISFSYELSRIEGRVGTPERPLSDLGAVSYRSYWTKAVLEAMREGKGNFSVREVSAATGIKPDDVTSTLDRLGLLKWWKGAKIIAATPRLIEDHLKTCKPGLEVVQGGVAWRGFGTLRAPRL